MSGADALALLRGHRTCLCAGLTWVPDDVLATPGSPSSDIASALVDLATRLELDLVFVPAERPWAEGAVERLHRNGVAACWAVSGPLGRTADQNGWSRTLRMTLADPARLDPELDCATQHALNDIERGLAAGCAAVVVADDLASDGGWLVAPDFAFDALLPRYGGMVSAILASGAVPVFHSDGDTRLLFAGLARLGFSAVHAGGVTGDALGTAWRTSRQDGLVILGGIAHGGCCDDDADTVAHMALAGELLVCDDGGIGSLRDVERYAEMLSVVRESFMKGSR